MAKESNTHLRNIENKLYSGFRVDGTNPKMSFSWGSS